MKTHTLLAFFLAFSLLSTSVTANSGLVKDFCVLFSRKPNLLRELRKSEKTWGVPISVQISILHAEGKFRTQGKGVLKRIFSSDETILFSSNTPYGRDVSSYGYSQALDGTWDEYRKSTGNKSAKLDSFRDNVDFLGWYISGSHRALDIPLDSAYDNYLAYREGRTAYARGTHKSKIWLLDMAKRIEDQSSTIARLLPSCLKS